MQSPIAKLSLADVDSASLVVPPVAVVEAAARAPGARFVELVSPLALVPDLRPALQAFTGGDKPVPCRFDVVGGDGSVAGTVFRWKSQGDSGAFVETNFNPFACVYAEGLSVSATDCFRMMGQYRSALCDYVVCAGVASSPAEVVGWFALAKVDAGARERCVKLQRMAWAHKTPGESDAACLDHGTSSSSSSSQNKKRARSQSSDPDEGDSGDGSDCVGGSKPYLYLTTIMVDAPREDDRVAALLLLHGHLWRYWGQIMIHRHSS